MITTINLSKKCGERKYSTVNLFNFNILILCTTSNLPRRYLKPIVDASKLNLSPSLLPNVLHTKSILVTNIERTERLSYMMITSYCITKSIILTYTSVKSSFRNRSKEWTNKVSLGLLHHRGELIQMKSISNMKQTCLKTFTSGR